MPLCILLQPTGKMFSDSQLVQPLVYMERLELMRNVCRDEALKNLSHTTVSKFVLDRIFVCDKHKILFCQTPKVGNTQWKKVLIVLNGVCSVWAVDIRAAGEGHWPVEAGGRQQRGAKGRDSSPEKVGSLIDCSLCVFLVSAVL